MSGNEIFGLPQEGLEPVETVVDDALGAMRRSFASHHRWCVTGGPAQLSGDDV
ncbi:MAG: hypothetical protein ACI9KE_000843 [Polyangiales bacterium]|jgi:hypothetical protein